GVIDDDGNHLTVRRGKAPRGFLYEGPRQDVQIDAGHVQVLGEHDLEACSPRLIADGKGAVGVGGIVLRAGPTDSQIDGLTGHVPDVGAQEDLLEEAARLPGIREELEALFPELESISRGRVDPE